MTGLTIILAVVFILTVRKYFKYREKYKLLRRVLIEELHKDRTDLFDGSDDEEVVSAHREGFYLAEEEIVSAVREVMNEVHNGM